MEDNDNEVLRPSKTIMVCVGYTPEEEILTQVRSYLLQPDIKVDKSMSINGNGSERTEYEVNQISAELENGNYSHGILIVSRDLQGISAVSAVRIAATLGSNLKKELVTVVLDGDWDRVQRKFVHKLYDIHRNLIRQDQK